jgi:hypothetical protein
MILICSSIVPIRSLADAYLNLTKPMSSPFAMIMHVEAISVQTKAAKILQCGFYWPTMFGDACAYCTSYECCQKLRSISKRNMMPLNPILVVEIFNVWGIDFIPSGFGTF